MLITSVLSLPQQRVESPTSSVHIENLVLATTATVDGWRCSQCLEWGQARCTSHGRAGPGQHIIVSWHLLQLHQVLARCWLGVQAQLLCRHTCSTLHSHRSRSAGSSSKGAGRTRCPGRDELPQLLHGVAQGLLGKDNSVRNECGAENSDRCELVAARQNGMQSILQWQRQRGFCSGSGSDESGLQRWAIDAHHALLLTGNRFTPRERL